MSARPSSEDQSVFVVGESGDGPGSKEWVWNEIGTHDGPAEFRGLETTAVAPLSPHLRKKAAEAYENGYLSRYALTAKDSHESQQTDDADNPHRTIPTLTTSARGYIRPPYDPTALAKQVQRNGTHSRCVEAKAQATAGYGISPTPHPEHAETNDADADGDGEPDSLERVREFYIGTDTKWQLGPNTQQATPERVWRAVMWDHIAIGWGCAEFTFTRDGSPSGVSHLPARTIRRRSDGPGFVELDSYGRIKQYYAPLGARFETAGDGEESSTFFVDRWTGETSSSREGVSEAATEVLFHANYTPVAPHYGLPGWISQVPTIAADAAAERYNARFFENDGVPRFVVAVQGGQLKEDSREDLTDQLRELSKEENSHRGVLLEATNAVVQSPDGSSQPASVSVDVIPLTVGEQEDASFTEFRKENEHRILSAHGVPPVIVGRTEDSNYANSHTQYQQYADEIVKPLQRDLESVIYRSFHVQCLDAPGVTVELQLDLGHNEKRNAEIAQVKYNSGGQFVWTVNQTLEQLGDDPITDDEGNPTELGETRMFELMMGMAGGGGLPGSASLPEGVSAPSGNGQGPSSTVPSESQPLPPQPERPAGPMGSPTPDAVGSPQPPATTSSDVVREYAFRAPDYSILGEWGGWTGGQGERTVDVTTDEADEDMDININITSHEAHDGETADSVSVTERTIGSECKPSRESVATSKYAKFEQGDLVSYGSGDDQRGLVLEVLVGTFDWPDPDDDEGEIEVEASQDNPVYIVARATSGTGVYAEDELSETDNFLEDVDADPEELAEEGEPAKIYEFVDDPHNPEEMEMALQMVRKLNVPGMNDPGIGFTPLPPNWTRLSVLKWWRTVGMTHTSCVPRMRPHVRSPVRFCAAGKDEVWQTTRWRNRF